MNRLQTWTLGIALGLCAGPLPLLGCAAPQLTPTEQAAIDAGADPSVVEAGAAQRVAGDFVDAASAFWPPLKLAAPLVAPLAPLFFKRPRKHYINAIKAVNPWSEVGGKGSVGIGEAADSMLKMLGIRHTSKKTEEVAEAEEAPKPPAEIS